MDTFYIAYFTASLHTAFLALVSAPSSRAVICYRTLTFILYCIIANFHGVFGRICTKIASRSYANLAVQTGVSAWGFWLVRLSLTES